MARHPRLRWGLPLTLLPLAFIAWFTLQPAPDAAESAARVPWTCLYPCGDQALRDAILNVLLFIPLGLALRQWLPASLAILLGLLTTCMVEFAQVAWILGRDASLRDILTNGLGAGLGVLLASGWRLLLFPGRAHGRLLAAVGFACWVGVVGATAWLVRPSLPPIMYWGQWAPELGQFETWQGRVLAADLNGLPLPSGRLGISRAVRERLQLDSVMLTARAVVARPPRRIAPIVSVFDSEQREIVLLGQRREGLVFRLRTGLRAVELGTPTILLPRLPTHLPGDTLTVSGGVVHGAWVVRAETRTERAEQRVPFSAGLMWSALIPFTPLLGPFTMVWSACWLGGLLLPVGYWARRGGVPWPVTVIAAAAGLAGLSQAAGLGWPPWSDHAGLGLGALLGALLGRWSLGRAGGPAAGERRPLSPLH